ncbi:hypothetical protein X743_14910 [Mesorhizobium sp. LNHC252B00]|nr:hypothetical protein X743_14910 [Mesorhizobium sp. LNHC252B00]
METLFDDLAQALKAPLKTSSRPLVGLAIIAIIGVCIGLGPALNNAAAHRPQPIKVRYRPDPIADMYPREI